MHASQTAIQLPACAQELVLGRLVGNGMAAAAYQLPAPVPGALAQLTQLRCMGRCKSGWAAATDVLVVSVLLSSTARAMPTCWCAAHSLHCLTLLLALCRISGCDQLTRMDKAWCSLPNLLVGEVSLGFTLLCASPQSICQLHLPATTAANE